MSPFILLLQKLHEIVTLLGHRIWGKLNLYPMAMVTGIWLQNQLPYPLCGKSWILFVCFYFCLH